MEFGVPLLLLGFALVFVHAVLGYGWGDISWLCMLFCLGVGMASVL